MSPTIRVDAEVWAWLQSQAKPFEDTPNSVLRRVAGLEKALSKAGQRDERRGGEMINAQPKRGVRVTGEMLNRKFKLGAKHALYHKDGTFYERLVEFPGVMCDRRGYVRYESREQFENDPNLKIGEKVNVRRAVSGHPRYKLFPEP